MSTFAAPRFRSKTACSVAALNVVRPQSEMISAPPSSAIRRVICNGVSGVGALANAVAKQPEQVPTGGVTGVVFLKPLKQLYKRGQLVLMLI
jgi:hypothetical protein